MRVSSNNTGSISYARTPSRGRRRAQRRPAVLSLCALAGTAVFLVCLHAEVSLLWALATAGFSTILFTMGLMFLWAIVSGIERLRE